jgi:D-alanine-D-alanine ligase-like ATP-grasp enzyme
MADHAEHRLEDGAFLNDMRAVLGANAVAALQRVAETLGLDYGGIDFALDAAGNVIVFEANATMTVPLPEPDAMWDYRRAPVARIHTAVRRMLVRRARVAHRH